MLLKCIWRAFVPLSVVNPSKKFYAPLHLLHGVHLYIFFNGQLKEVVDTLKDDAPHLDSILMHMGNMYATLKKFEESLHTYQRAVYIVETIYGECTFPLVMFFIFTICYYLPTFFNWPCQVRSYFNSFPFPDRYLRGNDLCIAVFHFQNSGIHNIILLLGNDSTILVTPYLGMAKALGSIGKAKKAIEIYQHVITLLESNRGAESKDLVVPLLSLGNLLLKEGRANDAESRFTRLSFLFIFSFHIYFISYSTFFYINSYLSFSTRVLNIYKKVYGENDGRIGMAMSSLAQVKCALGNFIITAVMLLFSL